MFLLPCSAVENKDIYKYKDTKYPYIYIYIQNTLKGLKIDNLISLKKMVHLEFFIFKINHLYQLIFQVHFTEIN